MRKVKFFALFSAAGLLASLMGCSGGGPSGGTTATTSLSNTTQTQVTATPGVASTAAPTPDASAAPGSATPSGTETPSESATPAGSATPGAVASAGDPAEGFDKASALPGYDDVKKLGKNPLAGKADAADKGKAVYTTNCASCHGDSGKGDGPAGAALDPKPRNQTDKSEYKYGTGDLAIFRTIKYGIPDTGMAPLGAKLKDDEIWQVVNYVKTLQK